MWSFSHCHYYLIWYRLWLLDVSARWRMSYVSSYLQHRELSSWPVPSTAVTCALPIMLGNTKAYCQAKIFLKIEKHATYKRTTWAAASYIFLICPAKYCLPFIFTSPDLPVCFSHDIATSIRIYSSAFGHYSTHSRLNYLHSFHCILMVTLSWHRLYSFGVSWVQLLTMCTRFQ